MIFLKFLCEKVKAILNVNSEKHILKCLNFFLNVIKNDICVKAQNYCSEKEPTLFSVWLF